MTDGRASSRDDWLRAGQTLLRSGGAPAVRLAELTRMLGLTTGSFYHHFSGMADYLKQLATHYGTGQVDRAVAVATDPDPVERLRALIRIARDEDMGRLDAAMRDWSGSNPVAATAVRRSDEALLSIVERAFRDLGHDRAGARARALLLFSAGVARVLPPWSVPRTIGEQFLTILTPLDGDD